MKRVHLFATALIMTGTSSARASEQAGLITGYTIPVGGSAALLVDGPRSTPPACATDPYWSIPDTVSAERLVAAIITAKAMGKTVSVVGTGNCDVTHPSREQVAWIGFD
ncbi:MAG: hypothetical protein KKH33_07035 [Alphaproteobacteria bacterium]|nr:hypothetical protein [Alphaproteobacteria bacterium]